LKKYDIGAVEIIEIDPEDESVSRKKHNNKPGDIDHTFRVDVRLKTFLRKLIGVVKAYFSVQLKSKSKKDELIESLAEKLKRDFPVLNGDEDLFYEIFSPICLLLLRSKFTNTISNSEVLDVEAKQKVITAKNKFVETRGDYSLADHRRDLLRHPILRLAKFLVEKDESCCEKFWRNI